MTLKNKVKAVSAAVLMGIVCGSASADVVILDGWQLITPLTNTSGIGRLNLSSGTATVQQEVNGLNQAFVGARFSESGAIFSIGYTPENVVGAGDSGDPTILGETLRLTFSNLMGKVTALNSGGGFHYEFTSGSFMVSNGSTNYASGSVIGLGGNASSTAVIGGFNGDSTVLSVIANILNSQFDMRDSDGLSLQSDLLTGKVFFEAIVNNLTTGSLGFGTCGFDSTAQCATVSIASSGDAYLARVVPEPGTLALAGFALLGLGAARRRRSAAE